MKSIKNNRPVVVGIFIFLGLVILVVAVFTLGGQKKSFVKSFTLNTVFDDVSGLQAGGNIWMSGVKIGTVKKISFYGNSKVLVIMSIEKTLEPLIHKNATAKISSDGLIGNKIVVISGGTPTSPEVANNDFLVQQTVVSTEDMLATLQSNNKNLLAITGAFKSITNKIDSGTGTLGYLLNNDAMAKKLSSSLNGLQAVIAHFNAASIKSEALLANLQAYTAKLNTQGTLASDLVSDTVVFNNLRLTTTQLRGAVNSATQMADNLKATTARLNETNNTAGALLNDSAMATSLKNTMRNLETSTQKLDEDLEAAQHNFLLRGYFKKKDKNKTN